MLTLLCSLATAADAPSIDEPAALGMRSKKDAALVVAVEDYLTLPDAVHARRDGAAFQGWLVGSRGLDATRVTTVEDATRSSARTGLEAAVKAVKKGGTLWIYWTGHGAVVDGQRVLLGSEATPEDLGGLSLVDVLAAAEKSKAKQVVVLLDVGFGGVGREGEPLFAGGEVAPLPVRTDDRVLVWSGTGAGEAAAVWPTVQHGVFSYFVVGALRGWADGQIGTAADGTVSVQEAQGYVARVVRQVGGGDQKPGKDTRPTVTAWPVATGTLEAGPSKEDLAALALAEKARRVKKAEAALLVVAAADWARIEPTTKTSTPDADAALRAFIAKYDAATVAVDGAQVAVAVPEVAAARGRLDEFAKAAAKAAKKGKKKKRTSAKGTTAPPPAPTGPCADLVALEPKAITGELTPELTACLESRIAQETSLSTKDKLSRMLMVDADAKGDVASWTKLAARHLEDFDRSDPDLCFKFALVLSRGDIEDAELVLKWSDYALENKHVWEGPTYMSRVYNLLRLKAETATRLWHDAEEDFMEERTEENGADAERYRGLAKDLSREWLDYARTSAQPEDRAHALCESASGNTAFCAPG